MPKSRVASKQPRRILVVDDHPIIRERLRELIEAEDGLTICGEATTGSEALELARDLSPDLVILDLTLRDSHGQDVIRSLTERLPSLPVLVFSMHDELLHAERVLRAGAKGYLSKEQPTRSLVEAMRTILQGGIYASDRIRARLAAKVAGRPRVKVRLSIDALTDRELRVFELLGQGYGTRQIADMLKIEIRTVETYRARIKKKLQIRTGNELLQHAIRWGQSGVLTAGTERARA